MTGSTKKMTHFILAAAALGGSAVFMQVAGGKGLLQVVKKPLPIRKPLRQFDHAALEPFEVMLDQPLKAEALEEVGTTEHFDYVVMPRTNQGRRSRINLTVFYYTGKQDQIPHVPEECLYQGGGSMLGDSTLSITLPKLGQKTDLRRVSFVMPGQIGEIHHSYYTICVNGNLYSSRNRARFGMTASDATHMYYAKIEIGVTDAVEKDEKKLDAMACDLMDKTLAELFRNHFPLRGWEKGGPPADKDASGGKSTREAS